MEKDNYKKRVDAYLDKKMSRKERALFEKELASNSDLQEAVFKYGLPDQPRSTEEDKIRKMAKKIREEMGDIPEPHLTWFDRMRYSFGEGGVFKWLISSVIALLLIFVLWNVIRTKSTVDNLGQYAMKAYCMGIAGSGSDTNSDLELFRKSSEIYCNQPSKEAVEGLNQLSVSCSEFCIVHYHLAHSYLESENYEEAIVAFEKCLQNRSYLSERFQFYNPYHEQMIRLNLILAKIGADANIEEIKVEIETLQKEVKEQTEIKEKIDELYRNLNNW